MDWLQIAQNLAPNRRVRIDCPECDLGRNKKAAVVSHDQSGYSCYCFACGSIGFRHKGKQTLEELNRIRKLNDEAINYKDYSIQLPKDFTTDIPIEGRLWLYKAGISEACWSKYNIGYSDNLKRVILPVYDRDNKLVWYQGRAVLKGQTPKYIQPSRERSKVLFQSSNLGDDIRRVIVVEDILSAIRVGNIIKTVSLLGTKITTGQASVLSRYNRVTLWLDGDKAGQQGANSIRKSLSLVTDVDVIRTEKDPKEYTNEQIKEILCLN